MMNKLVDLNKVIFSGKIYYKVNDLTLLFEGVSLYKIKKVINEMELETVKLKGFGTGNFILETDVNKLIINEQSVFLSTKVRVLSDEVKMTKLLNKMFAPTEKIANELVEKKINKFVSEEDFIIEETKEVKTIEENKEFNKEMELENIGFRKVFVCLKTQYKTTGINVLIDKDSNIVGSPYDNRYLVANNRFYINNTEEYSENPEVDYDLKLPLVTGIVEVNEDKIIRQLMEFAYDNNYEPDDFGGRVYANKFHLCDDDVYDLQHKNTLFCGIKY